MSDNTADSIQPLADEIMALCKTPAYDDMGWAEIDRALTLASHQVKIQFMLHGTLDPSPGDNQPPPEEDAVRSAPEAPHLKKRKSRWI